MTIKRIHPMSLAKVSGFLYAMLGLIIGLCVTLLSLAGAGKGGPLAGAFGAMFGVGAIIVFPILYGVIGFIGSLIGAALYNVAAGVVGGIVIDTE